MSLDNAHPNVAGITLLVAVLLLIGLAVVGLGCAAFRGNPEPTMDNFGDDPAFQYACIEAKTAAIRWYGKRYGGVVKVPFVSVERVPKSRLPTDWAQTVSAWRILLRDDCPPSVLRGVLAHEFRHTLAMFNGKGGSEAAVK